jgi:hypothetical protein
MIRRNSIILALLLALILISGPFFMAGADDDGDEQESGYQESESRGRETRARETRDTEQRSTRSRDSDDRDSDRESEHRESREKRYFVEDDREKEALNPVSDATYQEQCGTCHLAYQPELLPSASWKKIMSNLKDHFGEKVEVEDASKKMISDYLKANSADESSGELAAKIMRSLKGETPAKITEVPYIQEKHHRIPPATFKRKPVGSQSNCIACHAGAASGIYDEDDVTIPR